MYDQRGGEQKRYPVSLQCAAEAVFGPHEGLKQLLRQSKPEAKKKEEDGLADGAAAARIDGLLRS